MREALQCPSAPMVTAAFAVAAPLSCSRCASSPFLRAGPHFAPEATCARSSPSSPPSVPSPAGPPLLPSVPTRRSHPVSTFPAHRVAAAVAAVAMSLLGAAGVPRRAFAAPSKADVAASAAPAKHLRYDGRQELAGGEKAVSLGLTGGAFVALAVWAYRKNRVDDELETVRIKEEVERLEKLKAEFEDVEEDDDALDDEEFMAELNKRIAQDAAAENGDEDDNDEDDDGTDADVQNPDVGTKPSGTATIDRPGTGPVSDSGAPQSGADIEKLRRMWEADSSGDDKRNLKR